jgi:uncharacterized membrane protein YqaE (UPF0057 family)
MNTDKLINLIIALLLPPVSVFMQKGVGKHLAINIVLCFLLWLPASVHALLLLFGRIK